MVGFCVVFYLANFVLDVMSIWVNSEVNTAITVWLWIGSLIIFGVIDILLATLLLIDAKKLSKLLIGFAIVNLLMGLSELSIVFSLAVIFIFPIAMLILAISFLSKPEEIELV